MLMTLKALFRRRYVAVAAALMVNKKKKEKKCCAKILFLQRMKWHDFVETCGHRNDFKCHLRMPLESFKNLLDLIRPSLLVNEKMGALRGGHAILELVLYCALWYLAGGMYSDVYFFTGIGRTTFPNLTWKCIKAIA